MEKIKLVLSNGEIEQIYKEENSEKIIYKSFNDASELAEFINSSEIKQNKDFTYGLAWDLNNNIQDVAYIPKQEYSDIVEYVFDDVDSLKSFIDVQNLKGESIFNNFINEDSHSSEIDNFFSQEPCSFEGCDELRSIYEKEVEGSGGARCPSCTKSALIKKYTHLITDSNYLQEYIKENVNTNIQTK